MRPDRFVKRRHSPGERTATKETLSVFISVRQRGRERRMKIVKGRDLARRRETFPGCEKPIFKRRYDRSTFAHPRCTHTSLEGRAFDRQAVPSVIDREREEKGKKKSWQHIAKVSRHLSIEKTLDRNLPRPQKASGNLERLCYSRSPFFLCSLFLLFLYSSSAVGAGYRH